MIYNRVKTSTNKDQRFQVAQNTLWKNVLASHRPGLEIKQGRWCPGFAWYAATVMPAMMGWTHILCYASLRDDSIFGVFKKRDCSYWYQMFLEDGENNIIFGMVHRRANMNLSLNGSDQINCLIRNFDFSQIYCSDRTLYPKRWGVYLVIKMYFMS